MWRLCCFIISTSILCLLGSAGDKELVVPNIKTDGMQRRRGNIRGKTVVANDEQGGKLQPPYTLGGNHDL